MEDDLDARSRMFQKLQPVCVGLAKENTRDNIAKLSIQLKGIESPTIYQELQEYVLFPLRLILKQPKTLSEDLYIDACDCMAEVFTQTKVLKWGMCQDMFNTLCILLSSSQHYGKVGDVCEEMKLSIVKCLRALVKNCDSGLIVKLYSLQSLPALGHAVSILLDIAQNERAQHLRLEAIHCLMTLLQSHTKCNLTMHRILGDTFASFLPGVSMGLCKIITGDVKQGHILTVTALEAWQTIVVLVLGDRSLTLDDKQTEQLSTERTNGEIANLTVRRDSDWIKSTSSKLLILVQQIAAIRSHSSWKVRQCVVGWANALLTNCTQSLKDCMPVLLEVLVGLIGDEYSIVSSKSKSALEKFSRRHEEDTGRLSLVEILEDNLHALATSLPRQMKTADDQVKVSILNLLSGYIQLLGPHTCNLLHSVTHLRRLSLALLQVLEFDCGDVNKITEELTNTTGQGASALDPHVSAMAQRPRKYFKHFRDDQVFHKLVHICRLLGYYGDPHILVDHFLDLFHETKGHRLQSTLILNEVMVGTVTVEDTAPYHRQTEQKPTAELESLVRMLIDEYINALSNVDLRTSSRDSTITARSHQLSLLPLGKEKQPVENLKASVLQICLFLEGLGKFSQVLGKRFDPLLIKVLYPLMEKLGDDNTFIRSTAYLSLVDICTNCGYSSTDKLIQTNADYLINSISVKLRHLRLNPRAPLVLSVILEHSSAELLPLVYDTIQEVITALDQFHGEKAVMFMKVLRALVLAVETWYPPQKNKVTLLPCGAKQREVTGVDEVIEYFVEYHKIRVVSEGTVDEEETEDLDQTSPNLQDEEEKTKEIDQHVKVVKEVLLRSKHLMSSHDPRLRLLVLVTISHAVNVLQDYENELLPLVHQIWLPFTVRFNDDHILVTLQAFQTLANMAEICGDFIRQRTVKDVFPKLTRFLNKQSDESSRAGPAYKFTPGYKLQLVLLTDLGSLCYRLGIEERDVSLIAGACLSYLSCQQPEALQQACVQTFKQLMNIETDSIWLLLNSLYSPAVLDPLCPVFPKIKFASTEGMRNEYTDNVTLLLESA